MIKPNKNTFFFDTDKYLISEQPGLKILSFGIGLSLVLGLFLNALMNPDRIRQMALDAASHLHKDIKVTLDSAEVSLSDGIFPRFSVLVHNLRFESYNECLMSPEMIVDQIELPISIFSWIQGKNPIKKLFANKVDLRFFGEPKSCSGFLVSQEVFHPEKSIKESAKILLKNSVVPVIEKNNTSTIVTKSEVVIEFVQIESLRIEHKKYPQFKPVQLTQFKFFNKDPEKQIYNIEAKTHFVRDQLVGDYWSNENLNIEYKGSPYGEVGIHFFGNWREGYYSFLSSYRIHSDEFDMEGEIKQIPLSQIFVILKKWGWTSQDLNNKQVWVSARAKISGQSKSLGKTPLEINKIKLEGDIGDLSVDRINFLSMSPFQFEPFVLGIQRLDIDGLLSLLNARLKALFIGRLGFFKGHVDVDSLHKIKVSGVHSGLEFIFSNKGQRATQIIESSSVDIGFRDEQWNLNLTDFVLKDGTVNGHLNLVSDKDFKRIFLLFDSNHLSLSQRVQKLMTGGGGISPLSCHFKMKIDDTQLKDIKAEISSDFMDIEGVQIKKMKTTLEMQKENVLLNASAQNLGIKISSPVYTLIQPITEGYDDWKSGEFILFDKMSGQLRFANSKSVTWKNFSAFNESSQTRVFMDGQWNESGLLSGRVLARGLSSKSEWNLTGDRELPILKKKTSENFKIMESLSLAKDFFSATQISNA